MSLVFTCVLGFGFWFGEFVSFFGRDRSVVFRSFSEWFLCVYYCSGFCFEVGFFSELGFLVGNS